MTIGIDVAPLHGPLAGHYEASYVTPCARSSDSIAVSRGNPVEAGYAIRPCPLEAARAACEQALAYLGRAENMTVEQREAAIGMTAAEREAW